MKKIAYLFMFILLCTEGYTQKLSYAKKIVKTISSEAFFGRGYINKGDSLTASFLASEMEKTGLKNWNNSYYQTYKNNFNAIIGKTSVSINAKDLKPNTDFIVHPASASCKGSFPVITIDAEKIKDKNKLKDLLNNDFSSSFLLIDTLGFHNKELAQFAITLASDNFFNAKGIIEIHEGNLKYSARTFQKKFPIIQIKRSSIKEEDINEINLSIEAEFLENYNTRNVIGYIEGKTDTFLVFTAHYDHLGMMGTSLFPGANDNASGTAMVLDLARHFSKEKKPHYSIAFMLFSGEEAGLLGSRFYVEHPLFPLTKIKRLLNFDMVATGEDGLLALNTKPFPELLEQIEQANKTGNYFKTIRHTGISQSSDHYPFFIHGVEAIFFLTMKKNAPYHVPEDTFESCSFYSYENLFKLSLDLINYN